MTYKQNVKLWWSGLLWLRTREAEKYLAGGRWRLRWLRAASRWDRNRPPIPSVTTAIWYAPGWGAFNFPRFFAIIYLLNHGTRVLTGGAVVTWSRWFFLNRERYRAAKFITRFLNHFDQDHGRESADPLWGTTDTRGAAAGAVVFWSVIAVAVVALAVLLVRAGLQWMTP